MSEAARAAAAAALPAKRKVLSILDRARQAMLEVTSTMHDGQPSLDLDNDHDDQPHRRQRQQPMYFRHHERIDEDDSVVDYGIPDNAPPPPRFASVDDKYESDFEASPAASPDYRSADVQPVRYRGEMRPNSGE